MAESKSGILSDISRRGSFGISLAVLSFLVYAGLVLSLPQLRKVHYCCEQSSFAAAVSNVVYGAKLGSMYSGVFDFFVAHINDPLGPTLAAAKKPAAGGLPAAPPGAWQPTTLDGNGVGYPLVATAAFRLFGLHAWAPSLVMLILMAASAAAFLWRFSKTYSGAVILYFGALTVMLFTPMVWDPSWSIQVAVGGIRYFSLVCGLPIFHILLTLLNREPAPEESLRRDRWLLALQTIVLVIAMLVRGSALPLIGAIAIVGLALAWRHRHDTRQLRRLLRDFVVMGVASLGLLAAIIVSVPHEYRTHGRFGTVIWQRVTESLGINPAWPFPGTDKMFDCKKYVPQGLVAGPSDQNGGCIWFDYVIKHKIPIDSLGDMTFGPLYEKALRQAFFKIAAHYPGEVLKTFFYYKTLLIPQAIAADLTFNIGGDQARAVRPAGPKVIPYPPWAVGLLIAALGIALAYFAIATVALAEIRQMTEAALLSALFTLPAYFAAWALPHTCGDLLLYILFLAGIALGAILVGIRAAVRRFLAPASA